METVGLVEYGAGNIGSLQRAFGRCGARAEVIPGPEDLDRYPFVVLPGVGGFASAMTRLEADGWDTALRTHVTDGGWLMGICLGMQLLADRGIEGGSCAGLGLIPGEVRHLSDLGCDLRIPHVGWNDVHQSRTCDLLEGVPDRTDFYFANSYALDAQNLDHILGRVTHGVEFAAMVVTGRVMGIQFHPEKSSTAGLAILSNAVRMAS